MDLHSSGLGVFHADALKDVGAVGIGMTCMLRSQDTAFATEGELVDSALVY